MKPNIFNIATKELSQDAFITWLLQFADSDCRSHDASLNDCGMSFVVQLIKKQHSDFNESIQKVEAKRQWNKIDIYAKVNQKYLIIIEDKTSTTHHSGQLEKYKENSKKWCIENKYEPPICIYLKTGNESKISLEGIEKKGYFIFGRKDLLRLLDEFGSITNNIFTDFRERLASLEKSNLEFENKLIKDWKGNDWQGFFQFLEKDWKPFNWSYKNNPSGGFWCAVLSWEKWGNYPVYVQLEEGKLCFKISTSVKDTRINNEVRKSDIRAQVHNLIMTGAKEFGFNNVKRPKNFGSGTWMTVAVVDRENWLGKDDQTIDKQAVIKTLQDYLQFTKQVVARK